MRHTVQSLARTRKAITAAMNAAAHITPKKVTLPQLAFMEGPGPEAYADVNYRPPRTVYHEILDAHEELENEEAPTIN